MEALHVINRHGNQSLKHREMVEEWESWEHLIREDVRRLDHRFREAQTMMMRFQRSEVVEAYAVARLRQIIFEECCS